MLETRFARLPFHPAVKIYSEAGRQAKKKPHGSTNSKRSVASQLTLSYGLKANFIRFFNAVSMKCNRNQLG